MTRVFWEESRMGSSQRVRSVLPTAFLGVWDPLTEGFRGQRSWWSLLEWMGSRRHAHVHCTP